jgi:hypothetical protein
MDNQVVEARIRQQARDDHEALIARITQLAQKIDEMHAVVSKLSKKLAKTEE